MATATLRRPAAAAAEALLERSARRSARPWTTRWRDLARRRPAGALVGVLEAERRLVRLSDGLAVPAGLRRGAAHVIDGCGADGSFTLAELRDATGTSRRYAQALLERMDVDGTTPPRSTTTGSLRRRGAAEP